jgi:hypothetical protein
MKKSLLLTISAACALCAAADAPSVMDLRNGDFQYNANGSWTDVYNMSAATVDVDIFSATHAAPYGDAYEYYYGFLPCVSTSNVNQDNFLTNQWGCMAGGAVKVDAEGNVETTEAGEVVAEAGAPYLMAYWSEWSEPQAAAIYLSTEQSMEAKEIYICNQPYAYYVCLNGNGYGRALNQEGDALKLYIHGLDSDFEDNGKVVEHTLISAVDNGDGTFSPVGSTEWQRIDLSELGAINGIYFTMTSTDSGEYGINSPTYFCADRFTVAAADNSGVTAVEQDANNAEAVYYTIQGVRTAANALTPGVYVKVVNNKATKVVVR